MAPRNRVAKHAYALQCSSCGASVPADSPSDGQKTFCAACFRNNALKVEQWVLEDYAHFGVMSRTASTRLFMERLGHTTDVQQRKFLGLKIYEEFILATEDLAMIYYALRDRLSKPVILTMLDFEVRAETSQHWKQELDGATDEEILEKLGLTVNGSPVGLRQGRDPADLLATLRKAVGDMRAAAHHRTVEAGIMVQSFNKLKHGFLAVARDDFVKPPLVAKDWVATLMVNRQLGRFVYGQIEVTQTKLEEFAKTVESAALVGALVVLSYLQSTGWAPKQSVES